MRLLTAAFRAFLHGRCQADGAILLLRIKHADFATQRFAPQGKDVVSGGSTYLARGFHLPLPGDDEGDVETTLDLDITDLDDDLLDTILEADEDRPTVEVDIVRLTAPDTVEATFFFKVKDAEAPAQVLRATLSYEPLQSEPFPGVLFDQAHFPDLWP